MNLSIAASIVYPLRVCPVAADLARHLADEQHYEDRQTAIRRRADALLEDAAGQRLLEEDYPEIERAHRAIVNAVLNARLVASLTVAEAELRAAYLIAAHKQAAKLLEAERKQAEEDAALAAYEARVECWA